MSATNPYDPATPVDEQARATIQGTVNQASAQAATGIVLAGAVLVLTGPGNSTAFLTTTSDANGSYAFETLQPGTYNLSATQPSSYSTSVALTLTPGQRLSYEVSMTPIGGAGATVAHLTGVATKFDQIGLPPSQQDNSGIIVQLQGAGVRTVTDTQGNFDFFVNPGVYDVVFSAINYIATTRGSVSLPAGINTTIPNNPVVLVPNPGAITGVVKLSDVGAGSWSGISVGIAGSTPVLTDPNGNYTLNGLAAGTYTLTMSLSSYETQVLPGVVVAGGLSATASTVTLPRSEGTLQGSVILAGNTNNFSGVTVSIANTAYTAVTNANGLYQFTGVPTGTYTLDVSCVGYAPTTVTAVVAADSTRVASTVTLINYPGIVTGVVQLAGVSSGGWSGIGVSVGGVSGVTAADGTFTLSTVPAGAYALTASLAGYDGKTVPGVVVTAGASIAVGTLILNRSVGALQGTVSIPGNTNNLSGVTVTVQGTPYTTLATSTGAYQITGVPTGTYTVAIAAPGYNPVTVTGVVVAANLTTNVDTVNNGPATLFVNPGWITGVVQLANTTNWSGITVTVLGSSGAVTTSPTGTFSFAAAQGTYTLQATAAGYTSQTLAGVSVSAGAGTAAPTFVLPQATGNLQGVVTLQGTSNYGGIIISVMGSSLSTTTNASGAYELTGLATLNNPYTIIAQLTGYVSATSSAVNVTANATNTVPNLALQAQYGPFTVNNGNTYTNQKPVTLQLSTASGFAAKMRISEDAAFLNPGLGNTNFVPYATAANFTLDSNGDGRKTLYVQYEDSSGEPSNVFSASIVLDTNAPISSSPNGTFFQIDSGSVCTNSTIAQLVFTVTDVVSGVATMQVAQNANLNGQPMLPFQTPYTFTLSGTNGLQTIYARFYDAAGNVTAANNSNITLNTTPPTYTFAWSCIGNITIPVCNNSQVTLNVTSPTAVAMTVANDSYTNNPTTVALNQNISLPWLLDAGNGSRTVYITLTDAAGNKTLVPGQTVTVDGTPPASPSVLINGGSTETNNPNVTLSLSASDTYPVQFDVASCPSFSGCTTSGWQPMASTYTWDLNASIQGTQTVYVEYIDEALNMSAVASSSIIFDNVPPSLNLNPVEVVSNNQNFINSLSAFVLLSASGATNMQIACDGNRSELNSDPLVSYETSVDCLLPSGDGVKTVWAQFSDNAGNVSAQASGLAYLDTTAPSAPYVSSQSTIVNANSFIVELGALSSDANVPGGPLGTTFVYQVQGGPYNNWTDCGLALPQLSWSQSATCSTGADPNNPNGSFSFQLTQNAVNTLSVRARDRAGNVSASSTVQITENSTTPGLVRHQNPNGLVPFGSYDVNAGSGYAIITWEPPTTPNVAGFLLYYGYLNSQGQTLQQNGQMASSNANDLSAGALVAQGQSPIDMGFPCTSNPGGDNCSFTLTGLVNGTIFYIAIATYDTTQVPGPNVGPSTSLVSVYPAALDPTLLATLSPAAMGMPGGVTRDVVTRNGMAYVTTSNAAGNAATFSVVDLTNPANPNVVGEIGGLRTGNAMYIQGHYVYVADGGNGLVTINVTNPAAPSISSDQNIPTSLRATGIAGSASEIYVTTMMPSGSGTGVLYIYNIGGGGGSMGSPKLVGSWSTSNNLPDDLYAVAVQDNFAYVGGFTWGYVIDVSVPASPVLNNTFLTGQTVTGCNAVSVSGIYMFCSAGSSIYVINVSDPNNPTNVSSYATTGTTSSGLAFNGSYAFATMVGETGSAGITGGFNIFSVSIDNTPAQTHMGYVGGYSDANYMSPANPNQIGDGNYFMVAGIKASGNLILAGAGTDGLQVFAATQVRGLVQQQTSIASATEGTTAAYYNSMLIFVSGGTQEVTSDYQSLNQYMTMNGGLGVNMGLVVLNDIVVTAGAFFTSTLDVLRTDTKGPSPNPNYYSVVTTYSDANNFIWDAPTVLWPYAFVVAVDSNTFTNYSLRAINLINGTLAGSVALPTFDARYTGHNTTAAVAYDNYVYATTGNSIQVVNVANPAAMATHGIPDAAAGPMALYGHYLYLSSTDIWDLSNPNSPVQVGSGSSPSTTSTSIAVSGSYLYTIGLGGNPNVNTALGNATGMTIWNVASPNSPVLLGTAPLVDAVSPIVPVNNQVMVLNSGPDPWYIITMQ